MLTCREVADDLMRYLDGELEPIQRRRFRAHLAGCGSCASYLATYRACVTLARAVHRDERERRALPNDLVRSIGATLRDSRAQLWNVLAAVAASPLLFFYFGTR